jgi:hypothetical protein
MFGIQMESQAVLDIIKENDFHGAFEVWKENDGIAVYIPKETILKIFFSSHLLTITLYNLYVSVLIGVQYNNYLKEMEAKIE